MAGTIRSEYRKLFTGLPTLLAFVAALALPPMLAFATGVNMSSGHAAGRVAVENMGFEVAGFGQPMVILLAALGIAGEYTGGQIRTTLAATPDRLRLVVAKSVVTATTSAFIGLVAAPVSSLLEQWAAAGFSGFHATFTPGMAVNVLTVALNYMLIALIAQSLTLIARSIIVTLVVMIPLVLGMTIGLVPIFPILKYMPDLAGIQLLTTYPGIPLLSPFDGGVIMMLWCAGLVTIATVIFGKRDINN